MGKKLHERFSRVDPYDRESYACRQCEKIRAICCDCECCSECCQCDYCPLCDLPNGMGANECTCFQCEDCGKICTEEQQVVDDGDYTTEFFDPMKVLQYVCLKCYAKRKASHTV